MFRVNINIHRLFLHKTSNFNSRHDSRSNSCQLDREGEREGGAGGQGWKPSSNNMRMNNNNEHNACPQYLSSLLHTYTRTRQLRSASLNLLTQPRAKIAFDSRGFRHTGPSIWNSLPPHLRSIDTYTAFKSNLKTHLFCSASISGA